MGPLVECGQIISQKNNSNGLAVPCYNARSGWILEGISVTNGVEQGWILAPAIFSMKLAAMLTDGIKFSDDDVCLVCHNIKTPCLLEKAQSLFLNTAASKLQFSTN